MVRLPTVPPIARGHPAPYPSGLTISVRHLSATIAILRAAEQGFSGTGGRKFWVTPYPWPRGRRHIRGRETAGSGEVRERDRC
jgi:hypothetical protein